MTGTVAPPPPFNPHPQHHGRRLLLVCGRITTRHMNLTFYFYAVRHIVVITCKPANRPSLRVC